MAGRRAYLYGTHGHTPPLVKNAVWPPTMGGQTVGALTPGLMPLRPPTSTLVGVETRHPPDAWTRGRALLLWQEGHRLVWSECEDVVSDADTKRKYLGDGSLNARILEDGVGGGIAAGETDRHYSSRAQAPIDIADAGHFLKSRHRFVERGDCSAR